MKKIYLSIASLALGLTAISQNAVMHNQVGGKIPHPTKSTSQTHQNITTNVAGGLVKGRFDPGFSLITANGVQSSEIGGTGGKVGLFVDPVFVDSTVRQSFSNSTSHIGTMKFGTTFDPKSVIYNFNAALPLFTATDSYFLDTVWVAGVYQRKTNFTDTLIVEVIWGDTTNTTAFGRWSYASPYGYYGTWVTPRFTGTVTPQGNRAVLTAPLTNRRVFRHELTNADTAFFRINDYMPFVLNGATGIVIPPNNIVSVNVTYAPGQPTYSIGTVSYNPGTGPVPATMNGFAAIEYSQTSPAQPVAGQDYFDDLGRGKNYSQALYARQRYANDGGIFNSVMRGAIASAYWIDFSIHGVSTVGLKENSKKEFALAQNIPNPFTGESMVRYELSKEAKSVIFTVTDVTGRVISSQNVSGTTGVHAINLSSYAPGVYYYSLNVDGDVTTKKMIAQ